MIALYLIGAFLLVFVLLNLLDFGRID